jgi:DNA-binding NarL/FixJ family response regulator
LPSEAIAAVAKATVMLVDDHALLRTGVANIINQEADLEVIAEACDGVEAIDAFERYHPDVTLLDLRMPRMEGVEVVRRIRERDPQALFIVLTTYDTDDEIQPPRISSAASGLSSPDGPTSRRPPRPSSRKALRACSSRRARWHHSG